MKSASLMIAALAVSVSLATAHGQDAATSAPPNLLGKWEVVRADGAFGSEFLETAPRTEITIEAQQGALFTGFVAYQLDEGHPDFHDGSGPVRMAEEPFSGVIGFDNRTLMMVERSDTSVWTGSLINTETMALIYYEPGEHAFIARQLLVRR